MANLRIAVLGASGRMGQTLCSLIDQAPELALSGAWVRSPANYPELNNASADLAEALAGADVAIDFSLPETLSGIVGACVQHSVPLVCGVTGLVPRDKSLLETAANELPCLYDMNMSTGVHVTTELARLAAHLLGDDFEAEILDAHHRNKLDAPSGTALKLGEAIAEARAKNLEDLAVWTRHGVAQPRTRESIGFSSLRAGDIVGEHTVYFVDSAERIELKHVASDRAVFATGALRAARWLAAQPAGRLYGLRDVLGLD